MVSIGDYSRMVTAIHASAITPDHWLTAMTVIRESLAATASGLVIAEGASRLVKSASLSPEAMSEYMEHYHQVDYVLDAVEQGPVGLVRGGDALVALHAHSEFNADWLRPNQMQDGLFVRLTDEALPTTFLVAVPRKRESFATPDRVKLLNALTPHLQQALRTHAHLEDLTMGAGDAAGAIDGMHRPVIVVGDGATFVHGNTAAMALLEERDGLVVRNGRLTAGPAAADAELLTSVSNALNNGNSFGNAFLCQRVSGKHPYVVHVTPFVSPTHEAPARRALIVVVDPDSERQPPATLLRRLFGLTEAEAEVALLVVRGHGLRPISDELSVSLATVKTHLQRVFDKTGTHRQAEVVGLLLGLMP
jgi:DNA-binding CsgD family transcriptional regulator